MDEKEKVRPFSNGSQYADWQASNCERCKKYKAGEAPDCEIDLALLNAYVSDGTITLEIAARMGLPNGNYVWQCPEVDWTEEWKEEYRKLQHYQSLYPKVHKLHIHIG